VLAFPPLLKERARAAAPNIRRDAARVVRVEGVHITDFEPSKRSSGVSVFVIARSANPKILVVLVSICVSSVLWARRTLMSAEFDRNKVTFASSNVFTVNLFWRRAKAALSYEDV
jgi:hypothetical protein